MASAWTSVVMTSSAVPSIWACAQNGWCRRVLPWRSSSGCCDIAGQLVDLGSREMLALQVVRVAQDDTVHPHLRVRADDGDDDVSVEPVQVVQARCHLGVAAGPDREPGLVASQVYHE